MKNSSSTTSFLSKVLVGGISVFFADFLLSGVQISSLLSGIILVVVIILINFTIKPLIVLLTLPISLITFGLFLLVINAVVVLLAAELTPGFSVDGFWWAFLFGIIAPLFNGCIVAYISKFMVDQPGDRFIFAILAASASYIAVPAAMRLAAPKADPGLYIPMAIGVTFPFNITVGMPIYHAIIHQF